MRALATIMATVLVAVGAWSAPAQADVGSPRWVLVHANLLVDPVSDVMSTVRAAHDAGADTVLFSDVKTNTWWVWDQQHTWLSRMQQLRDDVHALGMQLVLETASVGYCDPLLFHDPDLSTGYPMTDVPLVVHDGRLDPVQTAHLANGSFETHAGNTPAGWGYQDGPGVASFVDTTVAADGDASMRFENALADNPYGNARIFTDVPVRPHQQYALRFQIRTDHLSAGFLGPAVRTADYRRNLTSQQPSVPAGGGERTYFDSASNLTLGWTQLVIPFNSQDQTSVNLGFGAWSWTAGTLWLDDVQVVPVPTLNVVRRAALPLTLRTSDGRPLAEGADVSPVVDPKLGRIAYRGNFDTYHSAPVLTVPAGSSLTEGDTVLLSGYHAQLTMAGQVGCSWHDPKLFAVSKAVFQHAAASIGADGYLLSVDEVRTGGWEPADAAYASSGASLAAYLKRALRDASTATGKPLYVWSDMLDPTANAVASYYQVRGTLDRSWVGVPSNATTVINWKSGHDLAARGAASVQHFAALGFRQLIAGFYDENVATNYQRWQRAIAGQPRITGSMYTTWTDDFSRLRSFARLWWPSG